MSILSSLGIFDVLNHIISKMRAYIFIILQKMSSFRAIFGQFGETCGFAYQPKSIPLSNGI